MRKPDPKTWATFPNLRGMAKEILPMLAGVLLGFVATIIAIALDKDFLEIEIWRRINTRPKISAIGINKSQTGRGPGKSTEVEEYV